MTGKLYVVATPIGNLGDMTARAVETLKTVDLIAAEDTRTSSVLLNHFGIKKKMISFHKYNEEARAGGVVSDMLSGLSAALISDAGTPCISDPGYLLVKQALLAGIDVVGVCGASAVITALSVSGFPLSSFAFYGFLPRKKNDILRVFTNAKQDHTQAAVFYESPKRITATMDLLMKSFPEAEICLCNDLTKKFERIYRGTAEAVKTLLEDNPDSGKGEYTLAVCWASSSDTERPAPAAWASSSGTERPAPVAWASSSGTELLAPEAMLVDIMVKQGCSMKDAINRLAEDNKGKLTKKSLYNASLNLKRMMNT